MNIELVELNCSNGCEMLINCKSKESSMEISIWTRDSRSTEEENRGEGRKEER